MKQSTTPTPVVLVTALAMVLFVLLLIWTSAAQAGTTVKSTKSNTSDRAIDQSGVEAHDGVKSSKSNSSERGGKHVITTPLSATERNFKSGMPKHGTLKAEPGPKAPARTGGNVDTLNNLIR